jgi:membrane-associated phospholipid phosphatase
MKSVKIFIIFSFVCIAHLGVSAQSLDYNILKQINSKYPSSNTWKTISSTAEPLSAAIPFGMIAVGLINHNQQLEKASYESAASLLTAAVITEAIKRVEKRPRPYVTYPNTFYPDEVDNGYSMPSGHVSLAFATATSVVLNYPKWYVAVPLYAWATSVAYSRMYLGQHYPSDVIAGAAVGAGSAYLCHWLNKKYFSKKQKH